MEIKKSNHRKLKKIKNSSNTTTESTNDLSEKTKNDGKNLKASTVDLIPYKKIESGRVIMKDNKYMTLLTIETKNMDGLNDDEQFKVMKSLENLMRIYDHDLSWLAMSFPAKVEDTIAYWRQLLQGATRGEGIPLENREGLIRARNWQLSWVMWAEANAKNLEFYFKIYGDNLKDIQNKEQLIQNLCRQTLGGYFMEDEKIEKILFKLSNLGSTI